MPTSSAREKGWQIFTRKYLTTRSLAGLKNILKNFSKISKFKREQNSLRENLELCVRTGETKNYLSVAQRIKLKIR